VNYGLTDNYDGIILDVMLPRKSSFQVLKEIRDEERKIPMLMLTAKSSVDDKVQGLDLGADDYRKKRIGLIFQNYNLINHIKIPK